LRRPRNDRHDARKAAWQPLLRGPLAESARRAIAAVAAECAKRAAERRGIAARKRTTLDPSLSGGSAGLAILYAYLSRTRGGRRYEQPAFRFLREAGDAVESVTMFPWLYSGFSGIAWAMAHVEGMLATSAERHSTEDVDEALKDFVSRPGWKADYDLVGGLVGLGVYALERLPAPRAASCLEGIVDRLEELAERRDGGTTWHTRPALLPPHQRKEAPRGYYNVGLAHGVPGVIAILGAAWAAGVRRRAARRLLEGAVRWVLRQDVEHRGATSFPAWVIPGRPAEACRSAWCYGSPGVATALFWAARNVGEKSWEQEALRIAGAAAERGADHAGVADAGLCHGAAGLGHIFNRLYQATGDETLMAAARFWFQRTLEMRRPGSGLGGFSALVGREDGSTYWDDVLALLTGAPGIALALLAATTAIEPAWDRMLLVSSPVRR
jgi:lantibiotic biosynthesis protein